MTDTFEIDNPFAVQRPKPTADVEGSLALVRTLTADWSDGRKYTIEEVYDDNDDTEAPGMLTDAATSFLLGYTGTFDFLLSVKGALNVYGRLTPAQAKGVLNCMLAETSRQRRNEAAKAQPQTPPMVTAKPIPDGYFTVVFPETEHTPADRITIRVRKPQQLLDGQDPNTRLIGFLSGPDNVSQYTNFGRVVGTQVQVFKSYFHNAKLRTAVRILAGMSDDERKEAGKAYAMESGHCCRCGRLLTVPASISAGIGPECAGKAW